MHTCMHCVEVKGNLMECMLELPQAMEVRMKLNDKPVTLLVKDLKELSQIT